MLLRKHRDGMFRREMQDTLLKHGFSPFPFLSFLESHTTSENFTNVPLPCPLRSWLGYSSRRGYTGSQTDGKWLLGCFYTL